MKIRSLAALGLCFLVVKCWEKTNFLVSYPRHAATKVLSFHINIGPAQDPVEKDLVQKSTAPAFVFPNVLLHQ